MIMNPVTVGVQLALCLLIFFVSDGVQGITFKKSETDKIFDQLSEGANQLNRIQIYGAMNRLGYPMTWVEIRQLMEGADTDGDGQLDKDEFYSMVCEAFSGGNVDNEIKKAFRVYDEDNNGYINAEELCKALRKLGKGQVSVDQAEEMIAKVDENGDGLVDFAEFTKMIQKDI